MGELPKYCVHDSHPAIIDRETFRKVQEKIARRAGKKRTSSKAKNALRESVAASRTAQDTTAYDERMGRLLACSF